MGVTAVRHNYMCVDSEEGLDFKDLCAGVINVWPQ